MIERLDPFNLPQQGADKLALSPATPKVQKDGDRSDGARPARQRNTKMPRRK
ncbi:MAG TPA: hypothetical protein VJV39_07020 [Dongiaceae bacterium]|nr:hypothetical protein [Dongiaceae bacterium]